MQLHPLNSVINAIYSMSNEELNDLFSPDGWARGNCELFINTDLFSIRISEKAEGEE